MTFSMGHRNMDEKLEVGGIDISMIIHRNPSNYHHQDCPTRQLWQLDIPCFLSQLQRQGALCFRLCLCCSERGLGLCTELFRSKNGDQEKHQTQRVMNQDECGCPILSHSFPILIYEKNTYLHIFIYMY